MKILGFDLGDGESAVAMLEDGSTIEPRMMPLQGRASLLSAVGTRGGRVAVGEEASVLSGARDVKVRFKSRYLTDPSASADVRAFAQGVMAELTKDEPALMAQVSCTVVGCPAGWGEGRRAQYAALMESAGFPNVSVVPEPRAAFLYARHARGLRIDPEMLSNSALVIDIGSSTTDFAYIVDGHQQALSAFGDTNLGGGLIDELLLERALRASVDEQALRRVFELSPAWRSYCELEARRLKEKFFLNEEAWRDRRLTKQLVVCYDQTLTLELALDGAAMEEIIHAPCAALGGRSFSACLAAALRAAALASAGCPPRAVILTGGASRMAFFRRACGDAFAGSLMVLCPEPECSIARGLAYAGRVDASLRVFREEVASMARGERLRAAVDARVHALYQPVADALFDTAKETAVDCVALWRKGGVDTISQLEALLGERMTEAFAGEALAQRLADALRAWTDALAAALEEELTALCLRCGVPPEQMRLTGARVDAGMRGVKLRLLDAMGLDVLSGVLGVVLAVAGASVCGGSGLALVGAGPAGMLAGAAAGALLAILGKGGAERLLSGVRLPVLMRQAVTDGAVRRGMDRQREQIERAVIEALHDPRNGFSARLTQSLAGTLGAQLEQMARHAEMSICA